jgi:protein-S-isoprenylcysteine O-methyltransferase Ste14
VDVLDAYHTCICYGILGLAGITFVALFFIVAPYGRHARRGWGPALNARVAWLFMESPAVFLFAAIYFAGDHWAELVPLVLLAIWQAHYVHRALVFPRQLPHTAKPMPLVPAALGFTFQVVNGWANARWISHLGHYDPSWLADPRFVLGASLFAAGMTINLRSDYALLRLKREADGYVLPRGGLFDYVTSPNYFGELLEWTGWAILTWSLPGLAFAVYTFANLAPRALAHRRWYRRRFPDYPSSRRALIPFVL